MADCTARGPRGRSVPATSAFCNMKSAMFYVECTILYQSGYLSLQYPTNVGYLSLQSNTRVYNVPPFEISFAKISNAKS